MSGTLHRVFDLLEMLPSDRAVQRFDGAVVPADAGPPQCLGLVNATGPQVVLQRSCTADAWAHGPPAPHPGAGASWKCSPFNHSPR